MKPPSGKAGKSVLWVTVASAGLGGLLVLLPRATAVAGLAGNGPLGVATALLYGVAGTWSLVRKGEDRLWLCAILLFAFGFLEWDPGRWFDPGGAGTAEYYADPEGSTPAITMALVTGSAIVITLALLVRRHGRGFLRTLAGGRADAWLAALGMALLPVVYGLDRFQAGLTWERGYRPWAGLKFGVGVAEEVLELAVPVFFLLALRQRPGGTDRGEKETTPAGRPGRFL